MARTSTVLDANADMAKNGSGDMVPHGSATGMVTGMQVPATSAVQVLAERYPSLSGNAADIQEILEENLGGRGMTNKDLRQIKMPRGGAVIWSYEDAVGNPLATKELRGIIVYQASPRSYWAQSFAETGNGVPPSCTSVSGLVGRGTFGRGSGGNPLGTCATCPMAQYGTKNGGAGQACAQSKVVYMLVEGDSFPCWVHLPATSIRPLADYMSALTQRKLRASGVITSIKLDVVKNAGGMAYTQATFSTAEILPEAVLYAVKAVAGGWRDAIKAGEAGQASQDNQANGVLTVGMETEKYVPAATDDDDSDPMSAPPF